MAEFLAARGASFLPEIARGTGRLPAETYDVMERIREAYGTPIEVYFPQREATEALLSEKGVIDALSHHGTELCYRLCSDAHHHHLTCSRCHRVVEVEQCGLGSWLDEVSSRHGFVATDHRVEITGLCAGCR